MPEVESFHSALCYGQDENLVAILDEPAESGQTVLRLFDPEADAWQTSHVDGRDTASIAFDDEHLWYLTPKGTAWFHDSEGGIHEQPLPDPGVFMARANALANVAGRVYACGLARVCEHRDGAWHHVGAPFKSFKLTERNADLVSLDGTSEHDLFAVGGSLLAHWDGKGWSRVDLPGLPDLGAGAFRLNRVRCEAPDRIYVVGDRAVFLEFDGAGWKGSQLPGFAALSPVKAMSAYELRDVCSFQGDLYVTGRDHLFRRRGGEWTTVAHGFPQDEKNDFLRLEVGGGKLWVMGSQRLFSFDGERWAVHPDPDHG
jgi:hypothetical protein